jgi:polyisoprenoid-binding protein YceI
MKATARIFWLIVGVLAPVPVATAAEPFAVDPVHSSVLFRVKHMNASFAYGRFNQVSGKFVLDEQDPAKSSFDLTITAESLDTANAKRDQHLKGPDFFNARQFPAITFKSKSVSKARGGYVASGDLTFRGVTRPVDVTVTASGTGKGMKGETLAGVEATMDLKRSDFGMTYMVGPIGDEVRVTASLEGNRN